MKRVVILPGLAAVLSLIATSALAQSCKPADAALAGNYQLSGVMETGSRIGLAADGRFGYMLSVGAYDEVARGCWTKRENTVVLTPTEIRANSGEPSFEVLTLTINAEGGLERTYQGKPYGVYERTGQ